MSSKRETGKSHRTSSSSSIAATDPKAKNVTVISSPKQLSNGVSELSLEDDGQWEVASRKTKNKGGSSSARQGYAAAATQQNPKSSGGGYGYSGGMRNNGGEGGAAYPTQQGPPDYRRSAGRGNGRSQYEQHRGGFNGNYAAAAAPAPSQGGRIPPPLEHGWNWDSRAGSTNRSRVSDEIVSLDENDGKEEDMKDEEGDDSDLVEDSDDDLQSEDFDSDASQQSHETRKKNRWFQKFFKTLDSLTSEEIAEPGRQWHCPACHGGPGAIDWYRGLQPLITHAKTKGSKRVKLHRELAEILDEELRKRGNLVIPAGEIFGKWKGLKDEDKDHDIVWPPMVVVRNTILEQDDNDKWVGMGNQELLDYFSTYAAERARHSYGPQGHRGISVLIFEASARGYLEAERLHKHFAEQGTDRNAWDQRRILFSSGGNRQLYGYMAVKEDLDIFNQHSQGKSKLKFELRSHQEMVVYQIRQMSEDNQQLTYLKNRVDKEKMNAKVLKESLGIVWEKLRKTKEENRIVRQRTQMHHEENKEEMYLQEQFFSSQIKLLHESREAKEENFERLQQEEREKVKKSSVNPSNTEENRKRAEEIESFIKLQDKEMEDFVAERDQLIKVREDKMAAMKRRHWEEVVGLEKEFDDELTRLMDKYSPHGIDNSVEGSGV